MSEQDDAADPDAAGPSSNPQHASSAGNKADPKRRKDPRPPNRRTICNPGGTPKLKPAAPKQSLAFSASARAAPQDTNLEVELAAINQALRGLWEGQVELTEMKRGLDTEKISKECALTARNSALKDRESIMAELRLIREERDKLKLIEATFVERLRLAEASNTVNEQKISLLLDQQSRLNDHMEKMDTHMENTCAALERIRIDSWRCSKQVSPKSDLLSDLKSSALSQPDSALLL